MCAHWCEIRVGCRILLPRICQRAFLLRSAGCLPRYLRCRPDSKCSQLVPLSILLIHLRAVRPHMTCPVVRCLDTLGPLARLCTFMPPHASSCALLRVCTSCGIVIVTIVKPCNAATHHAHPIHYYTCACTWSS